MLSDVGKKLMKCLKAIKNERDFVCGVMSNASDDASRRKLIDFIEESERNGVSPSTDDILTLSVILGSERAAKTRLPVVNVAAAM